MNESFVHPSDHNTKYSLIKLWRKKLVDNFNGYTTVQLPLVNDNNKHEDPLRNLGECIDLDYDDTEFITPPRCKHAEDLFKKLFR